MKNSTITNASKMLKAIANEKRLEIISILNDGELKVGDLEKKVNLSQSALSQHLAVLRKAHIVKTKRQSQTIFYSVKCEKTLKLLQLLETMFEKK